MNIFTQTSSKDFDYLQNFQKTLRFGFNDIFAIDSSLYNDSNTKTRVIAETPGFFYFSDKSMELKYDKNAKVYESIQMVQNLFNWYHFCITWTSVNASKISLQLPCYILKRLI